MDTDYCYLIAILFILYYYELYKPIMHYLCVCEGYTSDVSKSERSDVCPCGMKIK